MRLRTAMRAYRAMRWSTLDIPPRVEKAVRIIGPNASNKAIRAYVAKERLEKGAPKVVKAATHTPNALTRTAASAPVKPLQQPAAKKSKARTFLESLRDRFLLRRRGATL